MLLKSKLKLHFSTRKVFIRLCSKLSLMYPHQAVIAIGSNMGDSTKVMTDVIIQLQSLGVGQVESTSFLYESKPMYFSDQPSFLNAACLFKTQLSPIELLSKLKELERMIGRQESFRNGPRLIDLDIVFYNSEIFRNDNSSSNNSINNYSSSRSDYSSDSNNSSSSSNINTSDNSSSTRSNSSNNNIDNMDLIIPHTKMHERAFVLRPCMDLMPNYIHPILNKSLSQLWQELPYNNKHECKRVFPMGRYHNGSRRMLSMDKKAYICGILNVTPDSFSDGGQFNISVSASVQRVKEMIREGAHMIDIGGESTRPGSVEVQGEEELNRVIPVIKAIRAEGIDCIISVDTRRATVAEAAIVAGADVINDVSGGRYDKEMIPLSLRTMTPMIYMHMRGTPQTMTQKIYTQYTGSSCMSNITHNNNNTAQKSNSNVNNSEIDSSISTTMNSINRKSGNNNINDNNIPSTQNTTAVDIIADELKTQLQVGSALGIPRWMQIIDPGIGFAKTADTSALLLHPQQLTRLRCLLQDRLIMIGLSRKKFIEHLVLKGGHDIIHNSSSNSCNSERNNKIDVYSNYQLNKDGAATAATSVRTPLIALAAEDRDEGTIGGCLAALMSSNYTSTNNDNSSSSNNNRNDDNFINNHNQRIASVENNNNTINMISSINSCMDLQSSIILRVHNVKAIRQATDVFTQIIWPDK